MEVRICADAKALGESAAKLAAMTLRQEIAKKGYARIALSTGASQFETIDALTRQDVDWSKVEMYHLDEYVGLPVTHVASFRKYLQERFVDKVSPLKAVHFVDGTPQGIAALTNSIREKPIDLGLIGIGENSHIAFNDPPADFNTQQAYIVVNLDEKCKRQQMGEGWFATIDDVPAQAVSMTVYQIMQCKKIISCVPHSVKAWAVEKTLHTDTPDPHYPASILKTHPDMTLYIDMDSAKNVVNFDRL